MNMKNVVGNNWIPYRHRRLHIDGNMYKRYQYNNKWLSKDMSRTFQNNSWKPNNDVPVSIEI